MSLMNRFIAFMKAFCERKLLGYSFDQYIIMMMVFSMFLPYYFGVASLVLLVIYLVATKQLKTVIQDTPKGYMVMLFMLYIFIVSLTHHNYMGVGQSLGMCAIALFIMYYRKHVNHRLFTFIVDTCCLMSILSFIYGLIDYSIIVERLGFEFSDLVIFDRPENRVDSVFFNANYYATMIQFLVLMCIYKILHAKTLHRILFYTVTILCNLFALYLTGCRVGWISFIFTLPLMFFMNSWKKTTYAILGIYAFLGLAVIANPSIFPRIESILEDFAKRADIWMTAIKGIQEYPIFGLGGNGYTLIHKRFNGHPTFHSHSVYLDPILSYGIVGLTIASTFIYPVLREILHMLRYRINYELCGLIVSFIIVLLVHGVFDHTVFWLQTGVVFLLVVNAGCMYRDDQVKE